MTGSDFFKYRIALRIVVPDSVLTLLNVLADYFV
jgi:hypothetical protein